MFVHQPTKSLVLKLKHPERVLEALGEKNSRIIANPQGNVVVRHNIDTVRVLRNMGISAPSPILHEYGWPGRDTPFDHQRVMADVMTVHPRVFNLSEMGTGKTYAALWAADYLMSIGAVKRVAILTPLSTMRPTWEKDIFKILLHRTAVVVHGGKERRTKALSMDADFYIINHHGIALKDVASTLKKRKDIDLIILDEASEFRNHKTNLYRYLMWVMQKIAKRFWVMTGTPCPTEPADAWALCRMIAPENVPEFKGTFERQTMLQVSPTKSVPLKGYEQIIYDAMQPAVRFEKKNCLTLPPMTITDRQTSMSKEQTDAFEEMQNDMCTEIIRGKLEGVRITAVHAADRLNKLRQILCGNVYDKETGTYHEINYEPRFKDLMDIIYEAKAKVIVVVPFKGIIQNLEKRINAEGVTTGVLNGDVSVKQREIIIGNFKNNEDPHVLLCHPKVMAHGLNLTEADYLISYAPIFSYDQWAQVIERFNRPGQTRKMSVIRMAAHPIEWAIYKTLDARGAMQQTVLDLYEEVTVRANHGGH